MSVTYLKALLGDAGAGMDKSTGVTTLHDFLSALTTEVEDMRSKFNLHTHAADGAQGGAYNTSKPQSDAEDISQGTAVSVDKLADVE